MSSTADDALCVGEGQARPVAGPVTAMSLALALAYGGGYWLELVHPISGVTHGGDAAVSSWLLKSTLMLPVTLATVYAALWVTARRAFHRRATTVFTLASGVAVAAITAVCAPVLVTLFPDPHAHGQPLPVWYQLGDGLELVRLDVPIAAAVILLAQLRWPTRSYARARTRGSRWVPTRRDAG
jgi:lysylphosphatidylglycerol synthetase-like protein (DUF2156 family)